MHLGDGIGIPAGVLVASGAIAVGVAGTLIARDLLEAHGLELPLSRRG